MEAFLIFTTSTDFLPSIVSLLFPLFLWDIFALYSSDYKIPSSTSSLIHLKPTVSPSPALLPTKNKSGTCAWSHVDLNPDPKLKIVDCVILVTSF